MGTPKYDADLRDRLDEALTGCAILTDELASLAHDLDNATLTLAALTLRKVERLVHVELALRAEGARPC